MGVQKGVSSISGASLSERTRNKVHRQQLYVQHKRAAGKERRDERHRRRKEEDKDPELRSQRLEKNKPITLEQKREWDEVDDDSLGAVVDLAQLKRRRIEQDEAEALRQAEHDPEADEEVAQDDIESMLGSGEEDEEGAAARMERMQANRARRVPSLAPSTTSTNMDLTPESLALKFPTLFSDVPVEMPKLLVRRYGLFREGHVHFNGGS